MRYPEFHRQHLFVGSGAIEAGCNTVIGSRCKQPGMFWIVRGANAILALRCTQWSLSGLLGGPRCLIAALHPFYAAHPLNHRGLSPGWPYRMMGAVARQQLFLIDSFGFIFRAYHARARSGAPPMRTSTGFSTEAVYIFNNMPRKLAKQHRPA